MSNAIRLVAGLALGAALAGAPAARAQTGNGSLEFFGGWQNLQLSTGSVSNAVSGNEGTSIIGGDLLVGFGLLGLGADIDKTVSGNTQPWAGALMAGVLVPLKVVRLEAMGEVGRRASEFGDMFNSTGQTFLGLRPGVSFRFPSSPLILGVSGIARWNTSGGSADYGIVGRIGIGIF